MEPFKPFFRYLENNTGRSMLNISNMLLFGYSPGLKSPHRGRMGFGIIFKGMLANTGDSLNVDGLLEGLVANNTKMISTHKNAIISAMEEYYNMVGK